MIRLEGINDTIMKTLNNRQIHILKIIRQRGNLSSSLIFDLLNGNTSLITTKRDLAFLLKNKYLNTSGGGRSTTYSISFMGEVLLPIDAHKYCEIDPDKRKGAKDRYNFEFFKKINFDLFFKEENEILLKTSNDYKNKTKNISKVIEKNELERFIIEMSWKSSKIEGNTYTLLDTERLIKEGVEAKGHTKDEAVMILNHKKALEFVIEQENKFKKGINHLLVEEVHKLLVKNLRVNIGIRKSPVGITGTVYRPLENKFQIREALEELYTFVNKTKNHYTQALILLLGMSYIQAFEDGNKRTARLIANALLLSHKLSPLSYRSVDEELYREAILVFYETNSIIPMKKIFMEQYIFSAKTYLIN
jgi:fido (protein-threonine AMPylation protein)